MKKTIIFFILIVISSLPAYCQVQMSQYFMDETYLNAAQTGSAEALCVSLNGRQQWMGFEDPKENQLSPQSVIFSLHTPLYLVKSGLGINIISDNLILENNQTLKLNYAYHKNFDKKSGILSFGIASSLTQKTIKFDQLELEQPGDPLFHNQQSSSGKMIDFDLGLYYTDPMKFYAGVSATNIFGSSTEIGNLRFSQNRYFYATAGYYFMLIEHRRQKLYLIPSFLMKSNFVNMQIDLSARLEYNKMMAGISYRYQDAVALIAGLNHKGFRLGLSYDLTLGSMQKASSGSLEIFAGFCYKFNPKVKMSSLYNTRYL